MKHNKLAHAEKTLDKIHELATNDDYLLVPYSKNELAMARAVITKMEERLAAIADHAQDGLGD